MIMFEREFIIRIKHGETAPSKRLPPSVSIDHVMIYTTPPGGVIQREKLGAVRYECLVLLMFRRGVEFYPSNSTLKTPSNLPLRYRVRVRILEVCYNFSIISVLLHIHRL